jgi:hypothetical protein
MQAFSDHRLDSPEQNLKADLPVFSFIGPASRHGTPSRAGAGLGAFWHQASSKQLSTLPDG